jgi:hypothetical protein
MDNILWSDWSYSVQIHAILLCGSVPRIEASNDLCGKQPYTCYNILL